MTRGSNEQYWRVGSYLPDHFVIDEVEPRCPYRSITGPSADTSTRWGEVGLLLEDMVEPSPPPAVLLETGGFVNADLHPPD